MSVAQNISVIKISAHLSPFAFLDMCVGSQIVPNAHIGAAITRELYLPMGT